MNQLDQQIRERLRQYLDGAITLDAFEDWFVEAGWGVGDGPPRELVHTVERYLSEYSGGYRDEDELRAALETLAPRTSGLPRARH